MSQNERLGVETYPCENIWLRISVKRLPPLKDRYRHTVFQMTEHGDLKPPRLEESTGFSLMASSSPMTLSSQ